jgi:hypothetical protein
MRQRVAAGVALVATLAGTGLIAAAVAGRRLWLDGYISEAGVGASGHAEAYRLGAGLVALGQAALAFALWGHRHARVVPVTIGLLAVDAAFGGVSASVSCSPGCPLPPYEPSTARDLVHGAASILAVGLLCLAVLSIAELWPPGPLVGPSRVAAIVVVPLVAIDGLAMLIVGRGHLTGGLERAVLLGAVGWTVAVCWRLLRARALGGAT